MDAAGVEQLKASVIIVLGRIAFGNLHTKKPFPLE
jgi:hypothetical protein